MSTPVLRERFDTLTVREREIAEMFAWGAAKKEVADQLCISERTVENHARNIFSKIKCTKVNELAAAWFCHSFGISIERSPLRRRFLAVLALGVLLPQIIIHHPELQRPSRARTSRTATARPGRKDINPIEF